MSRHRKIHKETVFLADDNNSFVLPKNAEILCVQTQGNFICMWYIFDPYTTETEVRKFRVCETGQDIVLDNLDSNMWYIGTVQQRDLVWHVFEIYDET